MSAEAVLWIALGLSWALLIITLGSLDDRGDEVKALKKELVKRDDELRKWKHYANANKNARWQG